MDEKMKKYMPLFILLGLAFVGAGIYVVVNHVGMPVANPEHQAGFLLGLWQGLIIWLSFIASWFDNTIVLYQQYNSGFWYNAGYIIGLTAVLGAGGRAAKTNK